MPEFSFELPRIIPLVDEDLRKKLLGDVPTLSDITPVISLPIGFGVPGLGLDLFRPFKPVVEEAESEEGEEEG